MDEDVQCEWRDDDGRRCQWSEHPGDVHNVLGVPGRPTTPTLIP